MYSLELDTVENLWHCLKSHYWSNSVYEDYGALEALAIEVWCHIALDSDLMKTVCAVPWLKRATSG